MSGGPFVSGLAGAQAKRPSKIPEVLHTCIYIYILSCCMCVNELFVLSAGDLGSVDITSRVPHPGPPSP